MQFLWLFLVVCTATYAGSHNTDPTDPVPIDNNGVLWEVLYSKLNRLLSETNTLKEVLFDLKHRQKIQESQIAKLLECDHSHNQHQSTKSLDIRSDAQNGEWTVVLRRQDGSVDFQRNWAEYKQGFGNPDGEFFIGLERLHTMTSYGAPQELMIVLEDWDNERRYANYDLFRIGNEDEQYAIQELGAYSGNAGDSLSYHRRMKFSTADRSNSGRCPLNYGGGWWFNECEDSNLNSVYHHDHEVADMRKIVWHTWKGWKYSLKFAEMKIRPKV